MEVKDSGSVILKSYHSYGRSRLYLTEDTFVSPAPNGHSSINKKVCYPPTGRMTSQEMLRSSSLIRSSPSQEAPPPLEYNLMEDYWSEMKSIKEEDPEGYEAPPERQNMDEAELEKEWLKDAGLSMLVSESPVDEGPAEALLSTLTRSQAALVKKRMDNYTQTMRKRNRQSMRHVRDVFPSTAGRAPEEVEVPAPKPQAPPNKPLWIPTGGGQGRASVTQHRGEMLSSELPYSEGAASHKREGVCKDCRVSRDDGRELLKFQPSRPKLGLTEVQDLSSEDMKKVECIALIELTTFYDCLGIELKRNRSANRHKIGRENKIFGVPLVTLLDNDRKIFPDSRIPLVFKKLLSKLEQTGLQTEGILRVPGSVTRVKHLRQELEAGFYEGRFDWEQVRENDAAGLLKTFIRELPCPLLTLRYLPAFTAVLNIPSQKHQIQALHLLIMLLPEPHRDTLKALLEFLSKVVAHEEKNRMNLWNVSMIVAPNLFISQGKTGRPEEMQGAAGEAYLVRLLITHQDLLWTVPCFLIAHMRKMNEASLSRKTISSEKSMKRLLRRRNAERDKDRNELTDIREGVIRVHAPQHTKVSMAIQLNSEIKAKDVVARFNSENNKGSRYREQRQSWRQRQYLFEAGGNIGERCLDPETYLLDLYRVNPNCDWILKSKTA